MVTCFGWICKKLKLLPFVGHHYGLIDQHQLWHSALVMHQCCWRDQWQGAAVSGKFNVASSVTCTALLLTRFHIILQYIMPHACVHCSLHTSIDPNWFAGSTWITLHTHVDRRLFVPQRKRYEKVALHVCAWSRCTWLVQYVRNKHLFRNHHEWKPHSKPIKKHKLWSNMRIHRLLAGQICWRS
jgi:hypothetical protein